MGDMHLHMNLIAQALMLHGLKTMELTISGTEMVGAYVWRGKIDTPKWNITCNKDIPMKYKREEEVDPYKCTVGVRNLCFDYWKSFR